MVRSIAAEDPKCSPSTGVAQQPGSRTSIAGSGTDQNLDKSNSPICRRATRHPACRLMSGRWDAAKPSWSAPPSSRRLAKTRQTVQQFMRCRGKSASIALGSPEGDSVVQRSIFDRLLEARAAKRPAAHLRWLQHGDEALVVAGEVVIGAPLPQEILEAVRGAHRRDKGRTVETARGPLFI